MQYNKREQVLTFLVGTPETQNRLFDPESDGGSAYSHIVTVSDDAGAVTGRERSGFAKPTVHLVRGLRTLLLQAGHSQEEEEASHTRPAAAQLHASPACDAVVPTGHTAHSDAASPTPGLALPRGQEVHTLPPDSASARTTPSGGAGGVAAERSPTATL